MGAAIGCIWEIVRSNSTLSQADNITKNEFYSEDQWSTFTGFTL
jgi:hypothetical protein